MNAQEIWRPGLRIHLVGIGGTGLSAIATVLHESGHRVSGSDQQASERTRALQQSGIPVRIGHSQQPNEAIDALIYTSAVFGAGREEVDAARARGIPAFRREEVMQQVIGARPTVAIAGTHGKTTTTAMLVHVLKSGGRTPGFILGGALPDGQFASAGKEPLFVIEADEYDHMFLGLTPETAIVTSIEHEHPDFFPQPAAVMTAFQQFVERIPKDGLLIHCAEEEAVSRLVQERSFGLDRVGYGQTAGAAFRLRDIRLNRLSSRAVGVRDGREVVEICLPLAGGHNLLNAAAAMLAAERYGIALADAARSLAGFTGVDRRLSLRGDRAGLAVIDDYAHHPTAIRATIQAARQRYPQRQLIVLWQPHTFSRLAALWDEFSVAFTGADETLVTEIYAARETPLTGIDGARMAAAIRQPPARFAPDQQATLATLRQIIDPPACVLILSAGDASALAAPIMKEWDERASI